MLKALRVGLLLFLASVRLLASAGAATIVDDTFDSPGATVGNDANDPFDVAWSPIRQASLSIANDDGGINSGNSLNVVTSKNFAGLGADFPLVSLSLGDSITLSFDVRFTASPVADQGGLRFALENTTAPGSYVWREGTGGDNFGGVLLYQDTTFSGSGSVGFITTGSPFNNINDTNLHHISFQITDENMGMDMMIDVDGSSFHDFDSTLNGFSVFNRIEIGQGMEVGSPFRLDNVMIDLTSVPEPSSIRLELMALGAVFFWRGSWKQKHVSGIAH